MQLRRQSLAQNEDPSVDPVADSGRGTAERVEENGLNPGRTSVISVSKARKWDNAPLTEEKTDLLPGVGRCSILARSGNEATQHEEAHEGDGGMWQEMGDGDVASGTTEPAPSSNIIGTIALGAVIGFLAYAWNQDKKGEH